MEKIWFTADTHFGHRNVLKYCSGRSEVGGYALDDIEAHDRWLMDVWNRTVSKKDTVYIIGDFTFLTKEQARKLLCKLNGNKNLIIGNHDSSSLHLDGYLKMIQHINVRVFKKKVFPFLEEDFQVFMCHYPMITWASKHYGCVELHGHCHGRLDDYNEESTDLRVDVGLDGRLANYGLVDLETVYGYFKEKAGGKLFVEHAMDHKAITD